MEPECLSLRDLVSPKKSRTCMDNEEIKNNQKENVCHSFVERKKTTPHRRGLTPERVQVTPVKPGERAHPEPWTPTANLKVLMRAASPDMRDRETRKVLFRPFQNEREEVALDDPGQFDLMDGGADEFGKRPNRKQKSLGLLCQKFLALYPDYPVSSETTRISLDEVATSLGVERRRIYDIVNVLESLVLVSRVAKNQYLWHGRGQLGRTLQELHSLGHRQRYRQQLEQTEGAAARGREEAADEGAASRRKGKSLRIMSQKFVMLFLVSKTHVITLDTAAKILIEESQDSGSQSQYKTKVRRLYDIANVLTSLGLIKKVHVKEERGRKPAFTWTGPANFHGSRENLNAADAPAFLVSHEDPHPEVGERKKLERHASFGTAPTPVSEQLGVGSGPCSPYSDQASLDLSRQGECRQKFGDGQGNCLCSTTPIPISPPGAPVVSVAPYGSLPPPSHNLDAAKSNGLFLSLSHAPGGAEAEPRAQRSLAHFTNLTQVPVVVLYGSKVPDGRGGENRVSSVSESRQGILGKRKTDDEENLGGKRARSETELPQGRYTSRQRDKEGAPRVSPSHGCPEPAIQLQGKGSPGSSDGWKADRCSPPGGAPVSHYLYVPHSAGLNSVNALLSPGCGPALSSSDVPALALPYVLVPSSAFAPYRFVASGIPVGGEGYTLPAVASPAHLVVGPRHYVAGRPPWFSRSPLVISSTEQSKANGLVPLDSPLRQPMALDNTEMGPQTPLNPKEPGLSSSQAFFQTPGELGATPVSERRRSSAQRRLDVGAPPAD